MTTSVFLRSSTRSTTSTSSELCGRSRQPRPGTGTLRSGSERRTRRRSSYLTKTSSDFTDCQALGGKSMAKFNCGQCSTRHSPGDCPMDGATKRERAKSGSKPGGKQPEKPVCFPHKWGWTRYTSMNAVLHERHQECSKCHIEKPGSRDISKHRMNRGACKDCSFTAFS